MAGALSLTGTGQALRRRGGGRRPRPRDRGGRVLLAAGLVGVWQDHDAADGGRVRAARRGARSSSTVVDLVAGARRTSARSTRCSSPTRCSPSSTSHENVAFGLRYQRATKDEVRRRVGAALDLVQMGSWPSASRTSSPVASSSASRWPAPWCSSRPCCCSTSRWAPSTPSSASSSSSSCGTLQKTVGTTFVYVTHDQDEALTMSDRLAVLDKGKVDAGRHAERGLQRTREHPRRDVPRHRQPVGRPRDLDRRRGVTCSLGRVQVDLRVADHQADSGDDGLGDGAPGAGGRSRQNAPPVDGDQRAQGQVDTLTFRGAQTTSSSTCADLRLEAEVANVAGGTDWLEQGAEVSRRRRAPAGLA